MHTSTTAPSPFRSHRGLPSTPLRGVLGQLIQEWTQLSTASPATAVLLRSWARREPLLAGCLTLGDVVDRIDQADAGGASALLLALIRLAHSGQQLAARVVLQALLPGLTKVASSLRLETDREARYQDVVATMWDVLAAYPVERRPNAVASNLLRDTQHRLTFAHGRGRLPDVQVCEPTMLNDLVDRTGVDVPRQTGWMNQDTAVAAEASDLRDILAWGVNQQAITAADAALLTRVYLHGEPVAGSREQLASTQAAAELGATPAAVRKRCSRAAQALAAAVSRSLTDDRCAPVPHLELAS